MKHKIIEILKSYGLYAVLASIVAVLYLKQKKSKSNNVDETAQDVLKKYGITIPTAIDLYKNIALNLAHHLGTKYDWYDPRRWTENDEQVYKLLKDVTRSDFKIVSKLYFEVYAKGNDLSSDLASMLDSKYYEKLTVK